MCFVEVGLISDLLLTILMFQVKNLAESQVHN